MVEDGVMQSSNQQSSIHTPSQHQNLNINLQIKETIDQTAQNQVGLIKKLNASKSKTLTPVQQMDQRNDKCFDAISKTLQRQSAKPQYT